MNLSELLPEDQRIFIGGKKYAVTGLYARSGKVERIFIYVDGREHIIYPEEIERAKTRENVSDKMTNRKNET